MSLRAKFATNCLDRAFSEVTLEFGLKSTQKGAQTRVPYLRRVPLFGFLWFHVALFRVNWGSRWVHFAHPRFGGLAGSRNRHARGVCCGAKMVEPSLGDLVRFVAGELTGPARPRSCQGRGATSCTAAPSSALSSSSSYSSSVFDKQHCVWIAIVPISVFTVERRVGPRAPRATLCGRASICRLAIAGTLA